MIKFDDTPFGQACEALYYLTLNPLDDSTPDREKDYKELCENAVRKLMACVIEIGGHLR